jgi:large subunit ribosomal protein L21
MKYSVVTSGGKQYKVSEGDIIDVDKVEQKKDDKIIFEDVQLLVTDGKVELGKPFLAGVKVVGRVIEQFKGDKIRVSKFKAKVRTRRSIGFRAQLTKIQIEKIESGKVEKASTKPAVKTARKTK